MKHFTILEVNDTHEIMMVGTIQNITETNTKECFWEEIQELLENHFDSDVEIENVQKNIDLFDGDNSWVIEVKVGIEATINNFLQIEQQKYDITIMETWFSKNF